MGYNAMGTWVMGIWWVCTIHLLIYYNIDLQ